MNAGDRREWAHPLSAPEPPTHEPRTSREAVLRATGRERREWFALLDAWGAAGREHRVIAAWIMGEHGVDNWWAQTLTVDYEQARGMRAPGGSRDGTFAVGTSKTVAVPVERLFEAFVDAELRERWLPGAVMRERTSQTGRSAHFDWADGATRVNVGFTAKGSARGLSVEFAHPACRDRSLRYLMLHGSSIRPAALGNLPFQSARVDGVLPASSSGEEDTMSIPFGRRRRQITWRRTLPRLT